MDDQTFLKAVDTLAADLDTLQCEQQEDQRKLSSLIARIKALFRRHFGAGDHWRRVRRIETEKEEFSYIMPYLPNPSVGKCRIAVSKLVRLLGEVADEVKTYGLPSTMQNTVTLNFGPGASFTGPLAVGQTITQTYNAAAKVEEPELRQRLEDMVVQVGRLVELLDSEESKTEVSEQLSTFVEQAKKDKPSKTLLNLTADGMLEAAKAVAEMTTPVTTAVQAALDFLLRGGPKLSA